MTYDVEPYINLAGAIIKQAEEDYVAELSRVMTGSRIREEQIVRLRRGKKRSRGPELTPKQEAQRWVRDARSKAESLEKYFRGGGLTYYWDFHIAPDYLIRKATEKAEEKTLKGVRNMVKDIVDEELGIMTDERIREIVEDVIEEKLLKMSKKIMKDRRDDLEKRLKGEG